MPDPPPKHKSKPIAIPVVLLKCPEIQAFPSLLSTQATHGGIRVPVATNEFIDCVRFVHEVKSSKDADTMHLDVSSAGGSVRGPKWAPKAAKESKDPVLEAAERLLEKVSEATTKAPAGENEDTLGATNSQRQNRSIEINNALVRELETVRASVTRIVDQMDKKLDNSLELIRDTIADTAVDTVTQYLEHGLRETRDAVVETLRDMMEEEKQALVAPHLHKELDTVAGLVKEMNVTVVALESDVMDVRGEMKDLRSEIADMRGKLSEHMKATDAPATTAARPDSQLVVLKNQVSRTLDAIGRVELSLIDVQKKISDLPSTKSGGNTKSTGASRDADRILEAIHLAKERMLRKQEQALVILKDLPAATEDHVATENMEALHQKLASIDAFVKTQWSSLEAHIDKHSKAAETRLMNKLTVIEAHVHPDYLPSLLKIESVVRAHVNLVLEKLRELPSNTDDDVMGVPLNNDEDVKAFRENMMASTDKIHKLQATVSASMMARLLEIRKVLGAVHDNVNLLRETDIVRLENRISAIERGGASYERPPSGAQTRPPSRIGDSRPPVYTQGSYVPPLELFQIDNLIRNHVGRGFEDFKKWFVSTGISELRYACNAPGSQKEGNTSRAIFDHLDSSVAEIKSLIVANQASRTQAGDGRVIQYAATEITKLLKQVEDIPSIGDIGNKVDRLDGRLTEIEAQLTKLDPLAASLDKLAGLRDRQLDTIRPLLIPLRKLDQLDKIVALLDGADTRDMEEITKLGKAHMDKLNQVLLSLTPLEGLEDIKTSLGPHLQQQLGKLDQLEGIQHQLGKLDLLDHLQHEVERLDRAQHQSGKVDQSDGVPTTGPGSGGPDINNTTLADKLSKILSTIQSVDKRAYNTEVRLYDLKPSVLSMAGKLAAMDDLKASLASIEKHVTSLRLVPEVDADVLQQKVVAPLQEALDTKINQVHSENKSETDRFHTKVATILTAVKGLVAPLPSFKSQLNNITSQLDEVATHTRSYERDAAVRAQQLQSLELLLKTIIAAQDLQNGLSALTRKIEDARSIGGGISPPPEAPSSPLNHSPCPDAPASMESSTLTYRAPSSMAHRQQGSAPSTVCPDTPTHQMGSFADRFLTYRSHPSVSTASTRTTVPSILESPASPVRAPSDVTS